MEKIYYIEIHYFDDEEEVKEIERKFDLHDKKQALSLADSYEGINPIGIYDRNIYLEMHKDWIIAEDSKYMVAYDDICQDTITIWKKVNETEFKQLDDMYNGLLTELYKESH